MIENLKDNKVISQANKKDIHEFFENKVSQVDISLSRQCKILYLMLSIGELCKKDFKKMTKQDVNKLICDIKNKTKNNGDKIKPTTISDYKRMIKELWKYIKGKPNSKDYPKEVDGIKCNGKPPMKQEKDMITFEECKKMISREPNNRNKAIIMILFETGIRVGELMNMKTGDINFSANGFGEITVTGKTGTRTIPNFYMSAPYVKRYLAGHPNENKTKGYLWTQECNSKKPVSYTTISNILRNAGKRIKLDKPLNPHNFRHSAVTYWDKLGLSDQEKKVLAGWTTTKQLQTYSHVGNGQVKQRIMQLYGEVIDDKNKPEKQLKCPSCRTVNEINANFCAGCGWCLTDKALNERKQLQEGTEQLIVNNKKLISDMLEKLIDDKIATLHKNEHRKVNLSSRPHYKSF